MSFGLDVLKKAGMAPAENIEDILEKPSQTASGEANIKRIPHQQFNTWMHSAYVGSVVLVEYTSNEGGGRDKQRRVLSQALRARSAFDSVIRQRPGGIMIFITGERPDKIGADEERAIVVTNVKTDEELTAAIMKSAPGDVINWKWRTKQTPHILRLRTAQRQFAYTKAAKRGVSCLIVFDDDEGLAITITTKKSRGAYVK